MKYLAILLFTAFSSTLMAQSSYHKIDPIINEGYVIVNVNSESPKSYGKLNLYYFEKYAPTKDELIKVSFMDKKNRVLSEFMVEKVYQHNYMSLDVSQHLEEERYFSVLVENINNKTSYKLKVHCESY